MGLGIFSAALALGTLLAFAISRGAKWSPVGTALAMILVDGVIVAGGWAALWAAGLGR